MVWISLEQAAKHCSASLCHSLVPVSIYSTVLTIVNSNYFGRMSVALYFSSHEVLLLVTQPGYSCPALKPQFHVPVLLF
jgi:hypothetical protein